MSTFKTDVATSGLSFFDFQLFYKQFFVFEKHIFSILLMSFAQSEKGLISIIVSTFIGSILRKIVSSILLKKRAKNIDFVLSFDGVFSKRSHFGAIFFFKWEGAK